MRLIKFGKFYVNPDQVVVVALEGDRILIKLVTGEWIDAEASDVTNVLNRLIGGGGPA